MSVASGFCGFEVEYGPANDQVDEMQLLWDAQKSRTGNGCLRAYRATAGALTDTLFPNWPTMAAVTAGQKGQTRARFFIRAFTPCSIQYPVTSVAVGGSGQLAGISIRSDNKFTCWFWNGAAVTQSSVSVNAAPASDWSGWVQVDLTITLTEAGAADVVAVSAVLTFPGVALPETISLSTTANLGTFAISGVTFWDNVNVFGVGLSLTCDIYIDDWWQASATNAEVATMPNFPVGTRISLCRPTGQGSEADWTGHWAAAAKQHVVNSATDEKQSVTAIGSKTTFIHELASDLGIDSTGTIYGLMLYQEATCTIAGGASKFRLGGATVTGQGTVSTSLGQAPWYSDATTRTAAQFDALQWGVESNHATGQHRLFGMNVEVLHDGRAKSPHMLNLGQGYRHKWVTYTGDLSDLKAVTGVGFRPTFVFIQPVNAGSAVSPTARSAAMPSSASGTHGVLRMDADGFSVGKYAASNTAGQVYAALCIRDDGIVDGSSYKFQFRQGGIGSSPAIEEFVYSASALRVLFVMPSFGAASPAPFLKTIEMGTLQANLNGIATPSNTSFTLDANGFHTGTTAGISANSQMALYWGWANTAEVADFLTTGEIPQGSADVVVPVVFDDPLYYVIGRGNNNAVAGVRLNEAVFSGINCQKWNDAQIAYTNALPALTNTSFTMDGTSGALLGPSTKAWWFAIAGAGQVIPVGEVTFASGSITHPLTWMEFTDRDSNLKIFAEVDLCDRGSYYGGYKQPRVINFQSIRRGLSDPQGQIEHLAFGAVMSDTDRYFRGLLGNITGRYVTNRPLVERMIDDEDRRIELTPRLAAVGYVSDYEPMPDFQFRMSGQDWLKKKFMRRRDSLQSWQKKVTLADFPHATGAFQTEEGSSIKFDSVGDIIPIIYGRITDTNYTDDAGGADSGDGQFIPIYVGDYTILGESWRGVLVAAHHCAYIEEGYVDNDPVGIATNADWLTPRNVALWASAGFTNPWTTINGQDYCLIYVKGTAGDKFVGKVAPRDALSIPFAINVWGRTDTGTGSGALITNGFDIYLDFLRNYVAPATPWTSGAPLALPFFPTVDHTLVDADSFTACKTEAAARVSGGYVLDFAVQKPQSALDIIAAFNKNLDCEGYFKRNGQYAVTMEPVSLVSGAEKITDVLDIRAGTFKIVDEVQTNFFNVIPYVHTEDYCGRASSEWGSAWRSGTLEARDDISIANYDQERASGVFDFWMIRGRNRPSDSVYYNQGTTMVTDIVARILKRYANIRRVVTLGLPFTGLMYELGDIFPLTSVEGIGSQGWLNRTVRVLRHEVFPSEGKVILDCYDLEVVLGDFFHGDALLAVIATGTLGTSIRMKGAATLTVIASATFGTMKGQALLAVTAAGVLSGDMISLYVSFGGSSFEWKQDPTPTWIPANPVQVVLNSALLHSLSGIVTVRLAAAAGDVTARLRDVTNSVTSGTSSLVVAPGLTYTTVSFPVTLSSGIATYEIQLLPSLANTDVNMGSGQLGIL